MLGHSTASADTGSRSAMAQNAIAWLRHQRSARCGMVRRVVGWPIISRDPSPNFPPITAARRFARNGVPHRRDLHRTERNSIQCRDDDTARQAVQPANVSGRPGRSANVTDGSSRHGSPQTPLPGARPTPLPTAPASAVTQGASGSRHLWWYRSPALRRPVSRHARRRASLRSGPRTSRAAPPR